MLQVGKTYYHIKRPLFVLLNDLDEIRNQFVSVSIGDVRLARAAFDGREKRKGTVTTGLQMDRDGLSDVAGIPEGRHRARGVPGQCLRAVRLRPAGGSQERGRYRRGGPGRVSDRRRGSPEIDGIRRLGPGSRIPWTQARAVPTQARSSRA